MTGSLLSRAEFRDRALERDDGQCVVPWCTQPADDVHHIIERRCWPNDGTYLRNAASVCNPHHQAAEDNYIPPQAFWKWIGLDPLTPPEMDHDVNKWGDEFETPPWEDYRDRIKYPSTGHLPFSPEWDDTRADFRSVDPFIDVPLVVTIKMDGSNAMVTRDRVAARNGKHAEHQSFDYLKQMHANFAHKIPEHLQIFGEWLFARHSIHYTNGDCDCEDSGPPLESYFQIFGVYDQRFNLWLSWPAVEEWADTLGFPTVPVVTRTQYDAPYELFESLPEIAQSVVDRGHEGITVRTKYPYHYGQFGNRLAKYVRDGHVDPDADHWKHKPVMQNELVDNRD